MPSTSRTRPLRLLTNGNEPADEEGRRRRRRRGGRGRGRGRRPEDEAVEVAGEPATFDESEELEDLPTAQPAVHAFGSVWDNQLGMPTSSSLPPTVDLGGDVQRRRELRRARGARVPARRKTSAGSAPGSWRTARRPQSDCLPGRSRSRALWLAIAAAVVRQHAVAIDRRAAIGADRGAVRNRAVDRRIAVRGRRSASTASRARRASHGPRFRRSWRRCCVPSWRASSQRLRRCLWP